MSYNDIFPDPKELHCAFVHDVTPEVEFAIRQNPGAQSVVDLQCGPGWYAPSFQERGLKALGIDSSPEAVAFAARRKDVCWQVGSVENFQCEPVDILFMGLDSYAYLITDDQEQQFWKNAARSVKPGGVVIVETNHPKGYGYIDYSKVFTAGARIYPEMELIVKWGVNNPQMDLVTGTVETEILIARKNRDVRIVTSKERYHYPRDLRLMITASGEYSDVKFFGDYHLQSLEWNSPLMIAVATRK